MSIVNEVVTASVRQLAKSINAVASQLTADLQSDSSIVDSLAWAKAEMERLAEEAGELADDALESEQGKVGVT